MSAWRRCGRPLVTWLIASSRRCRPRRGSTRPNPNPISNLRAVVPDVALARSRSRCARIRGIGLATALEPAFVGRLPTPSVAGVASRRVEKPTGGPQGIGPRDWHEAEIARSHNCPSRATVSGEVCQRDTDKKGDQVCRARSGLVGESLRSSSRAAGVRCASRSGRSD